MSKEPKSKKKTVPVEELERGTESKNKFLNFVKKKELNQEIPFTGEGLIDWKKLIPEEFFVVNAEAFPKGTILPPVSQVEDRQKLILLAGFRYLAALRGVISKRDNVISSDRDNCTVSCHIEMGGEMADFWAEYGEVESEWSATASANESNTQNGMALAFKESIAENRAFCRAVRGLLRISIVGKDEISLGNGNVFNEEPQSQSSTGGSLPIDMLKELAVKMKKPSFEEFKVAILKCIEMKEFEGVSFAQFNWDEIDSIQSWEGFPKSVIFLLSARLREVFEKKK